MLACNSQATRDGQGERAPATRPECRPRRILACVLCQQRKVKCDRQFPCSNCSKHGAQCVQAKQARRRKRRLPESILIDRLRTYEQLLRKHHVSFEAMEPERFSVKNATEDTLDESDDEEPLTGEAGSSPASQAKGTDRFEVRSIWEAMTEECQHKDGNTPLATMLEASVKDACDQLPDLEHVLFGASSASSIELLKFHPGAVDIFRLWQVYLSNVDPVVKVTHAPTLQVRLIEAAGDLANVDRSLEALMFSIYYLAIVSLDAETCQNMFNGQPRDDLLSRYGSACQHALVKAAYLRCDDRDTLTALFLYLLSIRNGAHPRGLSTLLGVAVRIAQSMGIHRESALSKHSVFEAEMRRRLWWSLVVYDTRISEKGDFRDLSLSPIWDCRVPMNVNDCELRPDMKERPSAETLAPSEAIFAVSRSLVADFIRNTSVHLDFSTPALKQIARQLPDGGNIGIFQEKFEKERFAACDLDNPIHFVSVWATRAFLTKYRLFEHYWEISNAGMEQTDLQRDKALRIAFDMLEADSAMVASPSCSGFLWHLQSYFPFPAYVHIVQDLKRRPFGPLATQAWDAMSTNYDIRFAHVGAKPNPLFKMFGRTVYQAWEALVQSHRGGGPPLKPPKIIASIQERDEELQLGISVESGNYMKDFSTITHPSMQDAVENAHPPSSEIPNQGSFEMSTLNFDTAEFDWSSMGWGMYTAR